MTYAEFLAAKQRQVGSVGPEITEADVSPVLFGWQQQIVTWATRKGRAAIWATTGAGKTLMQIEWARLSADTSLIVAPLAVCQQTVREASKLGLTATYVRGAEQVTGPGVWVTNYEMVTHFDPSLFGAVVLDEASILKQHDGATRRILTEHFSIVPRRLACTATPAPNDVDELCTQAEFLGIMPRAEMLAAYFVHDQDGWRLKGHARQPMFRWMSTWAIALRSPADLGFDDTSFRLPPLTVTPHLLDVEVEPDDGALFAAGPGGVGGRARLRKQTLGVRVEKIIELVNASHGMAADGTKLAAWDGNLSTPQPGAPSTNLTRKNANGESLKADHLSATASTCGTTTETTKNDFSSTSVKPLNSETPDVASDTPPIRSTAPSASASQNSETSNPSATVACDAPSESPALSTTLNSSSKAEVAVSAARHSGTRLAGDSPSTTATNPAAYEESSAANATSDLASSATTPGYSPPQSPTSRPEPWVIWCGLNDEQDSLARAFGDRCFSLFGSMSPEDKVDMLYRWLDGERPILLTKPSIAGQGINMQHASRMAFCGLTDSWESYYQAIRRCWRYGQARPVDVHVVLSRPESPVLTNVLRKEQRAVALVDDLIEAMTKERAA